MMAKSKKRAQSSVTTPRVVVTQRIMLELQREIDSLYSMQADAIYTGWQRRVSLDGS
jgi:hypothetical protein